MINILYKIGSNLVFIVYKYCICSNFRIYFKEIPIVPRKIILIMYQEKLF